MDIDWRTQAEEFLSVLAWGVDVFMFPSLGKVFGPYASPGDRQRLRRQLRQLEQRGLVVREERAGRLLYQLTQRGRLVAMGNRNPDARWERPWDGKWRQVLFDLPVDQQPMRQKLLRWLRQNGFGYLQDSVWISPDPMDAVRDVLKPFRDDVEFFIVMEATVCAGYANRALVSGAWDFEEVNRRYRQYMELVADQSNREALARLPIWLRDERAAWIHAVSIDPMLPATLLPRDYRGREAWRIRRARLRGLLRPLAKSTR